MHDCILVICDPWVAPVVLDDHHGMQSCNGLIAHTAVTHMDHHACLWLITACMHVPWLITCMHACMHVCARCACAHACASSPCRHDNKVGLRTALGSQARAPVAACHVQLIVGRRGRAAVRSAASRSFAQPGAVHGAASRSPAQCAAQGNLPKLGRAHESVRSPVAHMICSRMTPAPRMCADPILQGLCVNPAARWLQGP